MSLEQMQRYLQEYYERPIALRQQGTTSVKCPYCEEMHEYDVKDTGHVVSVCEDRGMGIVIGDRHFVPGYGLTIIEYIVENGVNVLILDDD